MAADPLAEHTRRLAADGYTVVPDVLSDAELDQGRRLLDALYDRADPQLDAPGIALQGGRAAGREAAAPRRRGGGSSPTWSPRTRSSPRS
jgi:hypothetical protein